MHEQGDAATGWGSAGPRKRSELPAYIANTVWSRSTPTQLLQLVATTTFLWLLLRLHVSYRAVSPPEISAEILSAWKAILSTHATVARSIETLLHQRQKIPITWFEILSALRRNPQRRVRFRNLEEAVVLSRSALSRSVDALARAGLVQKEPCAEDQRGVDVLLTEAGNRALAAAWPVYTEGVARFFAAGLSREDCTRIAAILRRVQAAGTSHTSRNPPL